MKITRVNNKAADLLAISTGEGRLDFVTHIEERFNVRYKGDLRSVLKSRAVSFDIERAETENAKPLILEARSSVVKNPLRQISSVVMVLNDVTGVRNEERLKQNFLGLISHKLQTPVTVITGQLSILGEGILGELTDKQRKVITGALEESYRLSDLLNQLLGFVTIYGSKLEPSGESVRIKDYFRESADSLIKSPGGRKADLKIDCPDGALTRVNKTYFGLIIKTLVNNALKFNDKGIIKIVVGVRKKRDKVEISVSDNGPGIPPEEKEKVFGKFYQIEKYFTGNVEGAGLGLPLVRHLVTAYGGEIDLRSEIGEGSTFIFSLPS